MASKLDIAIKVLVDGARNLQKLDADMHKVSKTADTTKSRLQGALSPKNLAIGAGVGVATAAVVSYLGDAIDKASDLQESLNKSRVVFGDNAKEVEAWAGSLSDSFGISKQAGLEAAGTYGNLFQSFGIGQEKATEMSTTLVELAADLASFNNTSTEDAINALRSGLSGETEPLKRYGLALSDVRVKAKALELGIYSGTGAIDLAAKSQATYALILEGTKTAQGDMARSAGSLATEQKKLQAQLDEVSAEVGTQLLPVMTALVVFLSEQGIPALQSFFDALGTIGKGVGRVVEGYTLLRSGVLAIMEALPGDIAPAAEDIKRAMTEPIEKVPAVYDARASEAVRFAAQAIAAGGPVVALEAGKIAGMLPSEIKKRDAEIRAAGYDNIVAFGAGLIEGRDSPQAALDALAKAQEDTLSRSAEIALLKGQLAGSNLASGLNDSRPEVSLAARAAVTEINARLAQLGADGYTYGSGIGYSLANGIYSVVPVVRTAAGALANAVRGQAGILSEPKDHSSPLYGITKWGGNIVKTIAEGMTGELGVGKAAAAALASSLSPGAIGSDVRSASSSAGGALSTGGTVTNLTIVLQNHGDPILDEKDILETLQLLTPFITSQKAALAR